MVIELESKEKNKKNKWVYFLLLLLLIIGAAGGYYWYKTHQNPKELIAGDYPDVKDAQKMTKKQLEEYQKKKVDETQFTLTIFPEATFSKATSKGNIYIKNEPVNAYPINVRVMLDEGDKQIYESGMIEPGFEVTKAKLDKPLESGTYKATAYVDIYDNKSHEKRGTTQAVIEITVTE